MPDRENLDRAFFIYERGGGPPRAPLRRFAPNRFDAGRMVRNGVVEGGAEIGFSSNCTKNNFGPPARVSARQGTKKGPEAGPVK